MKLDSNSSEQLSINNISNEKEQINTPPTKDELINSLESQLEKQDDKIKKLETQSIKVRLLRADEIECRVSTVKKTDKSQGFSLLLYKDARCDMNVLDDTFGMLGWKREHSRDNANCTVSVWDNINKHWVSKEDTGTQSFTEKEKGLASDSFKRACFNLGIGRELYSAPFIWIKTSGDELYDTKRKDRYEKPIYSVNSRLKLKVAEIKYNEHKQIMYLKLIDNKGNVRFEQNNDSFVPVSTMTLENIRKYVKLNDKLENNILTKYAIFDLNELDILQGETVYKTLRDKYGVIK